MPKITFMGAGSTVFARNVLGDCMCTPSLCESEIALYDIDAERLEESYIILSAINKNTNGGKATLKTYCGVENRKEALRGADFVVNAIQVGFYDPCTIIDFEVPKKYGLRQTIADTLGISLVAFAAVVLRAVEHVPGGIFDSVHIGLGFFDFRAAVIDFGLTIGDLLLGFRL